MEDDISSQLLSCELIQHSFMVEKSSSKQTRMRVKSCVVGRDEMRKLSKILIDCGLDEKGFSEKRLTRDFCVGNENFIVTN